MSISILLELWNMTEQGSNEAEYFELCIHNYRICHFSQNVFWNGLVDIEGSGIEFVKADVHDFHTDHDIAFTEHGSVEMNCIRTIRGSHGYVQIH